MLSVRKSIVNLPLNFTFHYTFAGAAIQKLTDIKLEEPNTSSKVGEKTAMVRAARQLLSAITKVLLLADRVVVKQLLAAKNRVGTR